MLETFWNHHLYLYSTPFWKCHSHHFHNIFAIICYYFFQVHLQYITPGPLKKRPKPRNPGGHKTSKKRCQIARSIGLNTGDGRSGRDACRGRLLEISEMFCRAIVDRIWVKLVGTINIHKSQNINSILALVPSTVTLDQWMIHERIYTKYRWHVYCSVSWTTFPFKHAQMHHRTGRFILLGHFLTSPSLVAPGRGLDGEIDTYHGLQKANVHLLDKATTRLCQRKLFLVFFFRNAGLSDRLVFS